MSADRLIRKPIVGPDWGIVPDKYAPKTQVTIPTSLRLGVPTGSRPQIGADRDFAPGTIGQDWGTSIDKYAPRETQLKISHSLQLGVDNSHLKPVVQDNIASKIRANGAELILDPAGTHGKAIAYMEASIPHPPLAPIEGVEITYDKQTSIGLNGRKENKIILEGRNGAIALGLARFQLEEKTITIRTDTTQIQQASPHVVAA